MAKIYKNQKDKANCWFENVFGISEEKINFSEINIDNEKLKINGIEYSIGKFYESSLGDFETYKLPEKKESKISNKVKFIKGDIKKIQNNSEYNGDTFQVASNANCLEGVDHFFEKSNGITCYYRDHTQGPFAVICTPAATLYRNYYLKDINLYGKFENIKVIGGYPFVDELPGGYDDFYNYKVGVGSY